jgi:hypothetical protein
MSWFVLTLIQVDGETRTHAAERACFVGNSRQFPVFTRVPAASVKVWRIAVPQLGLSL